MRSIIIVIYLFSSYCVFSQNILLDDRFNDWEEIPKLHIDKSGDGGISGIDFQVLKMWHSEQYLFFYIETGKEINIQSSNAITMYLDTDNSSNTGLQIMGIGAELSFNFGNRGGSVHGNFGPVANIRHTHWGLVTSPTVTSDRFEIAVKRKFIVNNVEYNLDNQLKIAFSIEEANGDRLPDENGGVLYVFNPSTELNLPDYTIEKRDNRHLRFVAYNVERDKLFNPSVRQEYTRIFQALKPDIIGFSEIYDNSSSATAGLIENMLPSLSGQQWYSGGVFPDIKLISRYPIVDVRRVDGNGVFLLNMGSWRLICIVAHLPCCENETARQLEIDNIMSFVRDVRLGISPLDVSQGTPIIIAGDMNFVGYRAQLNTLLTGDIVNNHIYGPDFRPDWDETDMDDALPYVADAPFTYTWYSPSGTFSAGRLDYIVYTGSVLDKHNSFVLNTETMSSVNRLTSGLQLNDTGVASDHFPVVMDFSLKGTVSTYDNIEPNVQYSLYPNPSNGHEIILSFEKPNFRTTNFTIYSSDGKRLEEHKIKAQFNQYSFSCSHLPKGNYYIVFEKESGLKNSSFILY